MELYRDWNQNQGGWLRLRNSHLTQTCRGKFIVDLWSVWLWLFQVFSKIYSGPKNITTIVVIFLCSLVLVKVKVIDICACKLYLCYEALLATVSMGIPWEFIYSASCIQGNNNFICCVADVFALLKSVFLKERFSQIREVNFSCCWPCHHSWFDLIWGWTLHLISLTHWIFQSFSEDFWNSLEFYCDFPQKSCFQNKGEKQSTIK